MTREEVTSQIRKSLGNYLASFPLADMVDDFIETYGCVEVSDVPEDEYWALVEQHDTIWIARG